MAIDFEVVQGVERGLHAALISGLKVSGPDGYHVCKEFVKEAANIQSHREDLKKKCERLRMAREELMNVHL